MGLLFILIYQIRCDKTEYGILTEEERYLRPATKKLFIKLYESLNRQNLDRMKLKVYPKYRFDQMKWN